MRRLLITSLALVAALPAVSSAAEDMPVRFTARVSWIASDTMVVSTAASPAVSVDLSQVPQDEYQRLVTGTYVVITGTITWRRVTATSIEALEPSP